MPRRGREMPGARRVSLPITAEVTTLWRQHAREEDLHRHRLARPIPEHKIGDARDRRPILAPTAARRRRLGDFRPLTFGRRPPPGGWLHPPPPSHPSE